MRNLILIALLPLLGACGLFGSSVSAANIQITTTTATALGAYWDARGAEFDRLFMLGNPAGPIADRFHSQMSSEDRAFHDLLTAHLAHLQALGMVDPQTATAQALALAQQIKDMFHPTRTP